MSTVTAAAMYRVLMAGELTSGGHYARPTAAQKTHEMLQGFLALGGREKYIHYQDVVLHNNGIWKNVSSHAGVFNDAFQRGFIETKAPRSGLYRLTEKALVRIPEKPLSFDDIPDAAKAVFRQDVHGTENVLRA